MPAKILLSHLSSVVPKFTLKPSTAEIINGLELHFSSEEAVHRFYQQFFEKFVQSGRGFEYEGTMDITIPEERDAKWVVTCSSKLNEKNSYGYQIPIFKNTQTNLKDKHPIEIENFSQSELEDLNELYYSRWQKLLGIWGDYFDIPPLDEFFTQTPKIIPHSNKPNIFEYSFEIPIDQSVQPLAKQKQVFPPIARDPSTYSNILTTIETQGNTKITSAKDFPGADIGWPYQRHYDPDYITLLKTQTEQTLKEKTRKRKYLDELPSKAKIVEFGVGAGNVISDTKELRPDITYIGVGITPLKQENVPKCDHIYYAPVPDHTQLLKDHFGTVDRVIEAFGPTTYAKNPVHALIYAALLLKTGGEFLGIFSGLPHNYDASPLGDGLDRLKLSLFFAKYLGIHLVIEKTKVESKVNPGTIVEDFVLSFVKGVDAKAFTFEDFISLCKLADKFLGSPTEVRDLDDNFGKFGSQSIKEIQYRGATASFFNNKTGEDPDNNNIPNGHLANGTPQMVLVN